MSAEDACILIEGNDPEPSQIKIWRKINEGDSQYALVRIIVDGYHDPYYEYVFDFSMHDMWRRMGQAIGSNQSLRFLNLFYDYCNDFSDIPFEAAAAQSIESFYDGLKENESITHLDYDLRDDLPMFDLDYHARNNKKLEELSLRAHGRLRLDQSRLISTAIRNSVLRQLKLWVDSLDSWEMVILACSRLRTLDIHCSGSSSFAALAALLRDPTAILEIVRLYGGFDNEELSLIVTSLVGNKNLKKLWLESYIDVSDFDLNSIGPLLCDVASIESIHSSNHTLEKVDVYIGDLYLPEHVRNLLDLNKNGDKEEVVRRKIAQYYFIGDFDTAPFDNMPVSLLPQVMSLIEGGVINRHTAIFRMLRNIPELCNMSCRNTEE